MSTPYSTGHLPCLVGDQVVVRYATWWLGGGRSGMRTQPPLRRDEVVIYWTTRRSGDISGSVFYSLFQKNISFYLFFLLIH